VHMTCVFQLVQLAGRRHIEHAGHGNELQLVQLVGIPTIYQLVQLAGISTWQTFQQVDF
jgi:hypothetical protein